MQSVPTKKSQGGDIAQIENDASTGNFSSGVTNPLKIKYGRWNESYKAVLRVEVQYSHLPIAVVNVARLLLATLNHLMCGFLNE